MDGQPRRGGRGSSSSRGGGRGSRGGGSRGGGRGSRGGGSRGGGRGSRGEGARGRGGGRGGAVAGRAMGSSKKSESPATPAEKYIVIISNVENDMAKVHHDRLRSFLCLDAAREGRASLQANKQQERGTKKLAAGKACYYELSCRSETRSAELAVFGPADANVGTVFVGSSTVKAGGDGADADPTAKNNAENAAVGDKDATGELAISEQLVKGPATEENRHHAFDSLPDMSATLSTKPYFTHRIGFHVNLPGKEAGDVLELTAACQSRLEKRQRHLQQQQQQQHTTGEKSASGRKHERAEASEETVEKEESQRKASRTEDVADSVSEGDTSSEGKQSNPGEDGGGAPPLRQFPFHQKDLVTAVAVVSTGQWTAREVRHQLKDLPGFLSCWRLYARHFRVTFEDKTSLFKAKQLLDQFHLDGNVRVTINLSDALGRLNADFVAKEDGVGDVAVA